MDLREDKNVINKLADRGKKPVTPEQGEQMRQDIKAVRYMECSAKTGQGVKPVFDEAIRVFLNAKKEQPKKDKKCELL